MAATFRPPMSVRAEVVGNDRLSTAVAAGRALTFQDVLEMRTAWIGTEGIEWAAGIVTRARERAAVINEGTEPMSETRDDAMPAPMLDELPEPAAPVYGVDKDVVPDSIMAADAALDAAQSLLEGCGCMDDPTVNQAYYLVKAADAALGQAIEALGMVDADDEISEGEVVTDDAVAGEGDRAADAEVEARKAAIASAERMTVAAEIRKVATDDGSLRVAGYAATFNQEATGLPFREQIAPGAFTRSLDSGAPVFLLVNHDTDGLPLASTQSGTMSLRQDEHGLLMEANLDPANPRAAELASALSRGDVDKMSFAFTVNPGGETRDGGVRTLTDITLYEVSVVTFPAYDSTTVGMRSAADEAADLEARRRILAARLERLKSH